MSAEGKEQFVRNGSDVLLVLAPPYAATRGRPAPSHFLEDILCMELAYHSRGFRTPRLTGRVEILDIVRQVVRRNPGHGPPAHVIIVMILPVFRAL